MFWLANVVEGKSDGCPKEEKRENHQEISLQAAEWSTVI